MTRLLQVLLILAAPLAWGAPDGAAIYKQHCASCHGDEGEGVDDEYDEALVGKRSIDWLTKYIDESMPEFEEHLVVGKDARAVSEYIYDAFYSPEAQAKKKPVRKDLLRLSQHQHRRAITDIVQTFIGGHPWMGEEHGLRGNYFNKEKMNNRKHALVKRIDPTINFDAQKDHGVEGLNLKAHSIYWTGSLNPPETGVYQFRVNTPNGVRFWLNETNQNKDAFIDAWVSSGNQMRSQEASMFLLAGHGVPIIIDFVAFKERKSSLSIDWKPPHGVWEPLPNSVLHTDGSKPALIIETPFPADDASMGYERGSSISKAWKEATTRAAIEATATIFEHIDKIAKTKPDAEDREERLRSFCSEFTSRAFCRPLSDKQKKLYVDDIFTAAAGDLDTAVKRSLMLTLTSPYFLYPSLNLNEKGEPDSYTNAAHMALAIWDSVPDMHLRKKAGKGQLNTEKQIKDELWRMLGDSRAKVKINRFFHHWLALSEKEDLGKDPKVFPGFDKALIADLRSSLNLFINDVVWEEPSDYRKLFTSDQLYLNDRLASFYGAEKSQGDGFVQVTPPDRKRAGLFTHPYILSAFSYHRQTSPIHRGVYLGRNVLGRFLKPPPNAIEFKDADFDPSLTMREKVTELTKDKSCMSCHSIINPVGFSLEYYDAVGRFRTQDNNKPINAESDYETPDAEKIRITGPDDLARLAVESPEAHQAFLKHLFHHLIQQPVNAYGFDQMDQFHHAFQKSGFHIKNIITVMAFESLPREPQK
ncbi:MAG: DUF1592 domain-containing protein [Akkermansiaceae bacterium]